MEPAEGSRIVLTPRKYPLELRDRAVELVASSGRPIAHIADELGINRETLRSWVRRAEADRGQRPELLSSDEREELKRLRRENSSCTAPTRSSRPPRLFSPRSCAPRGAEMIEGG